MRTSNKLGFTLVELLIVIALLGALAIGLLATVDPFEQLKKGRDTATRNTVSELYNGFIRYYAINSRFPWGTAGLTGAILSGSGMLNYITEVANAGELKEKFVDLATTGRLAKISITSTSPSGAGIAKEQVSVCYSPESKSFRKDDNTMFNISGDTVNISNCTGRGGAETCYWCMQ